MAIRITEEELKEHIEVYYMHHENSNGEIHPNTKKAFLVKDVVWLFSNIDRLRYNKRNGIKES